MAEYTSDQLRLILAMSADITSLQNSLKKATGDTKKAADNMNTSLNSIGTRGAGADPTRRMQDSISKMQGSMRAATGNMTAQLNDISTTLLSGSSPFTVMVQQGSQVTQILQEMAATAQRTGQSFSVFQLIGGAFKNLLSPMSLVVNGLILIAGTILPKVIAMFTQSTGDIKKNMEALKGIVDTYGILDPAAQKVIQTFLRQQEVVDVLEKMKKSIADLGAMSLDTLSTSIVKFADLASAAMDLKGPVEGAKLVDAFKTRWQDLIDTIEAGKDPMEAITALITDLGKAEDFAPGIGFKEMADTLKNDVLPNLQKTHDTQAAVIQLQKVLAKGGGEAAESQKKYNDAMQKMQDMAEGPLSDVEKVLEQHKIALEAATKAGGDYATQLGKITAANLTMENAMAALQTKGIEGMVSDLNLASTDLEKLFMSLEGGSWGKGFHDLSKSTAYGAFGFTKGTFASSMRAADPSLKGVSDAIIWGQRESLEMQKKAFSGLVKMNAAAIVAAGGTPNATNLYMAHFLGSGAAQKIIRNPQQAPGLSADALRNHPELRGKTGAEIQAMISQKVNAKSASLGLADQKETVDVAKQEAEIRGEIGTAMDENIRKQEEALKFAELRRDLEKKAAEEGRAVSQEEIARAKEIAAAWGQTQGAVAGHKKELADAKTLADALRSVETKTSEINAELEAVNALGGAYDQLLYKKEKAGIIAVLTAKASADGTAATKEEAAAIERVADAQAKAVATQAAYNQAQKDITKSTKLSQEQAKQLAETYADMATQFFSGFISDMRAGKSATEALSNALGRLGDQLLDMALNMLFKQLFGNLFGVAGGGIAGGVTGGGVGLYKAGGTVGMSRHQDGRRFNPLLWSGAPKFGAGGFVGLRPGEVPIIAHRGELVIPASGLATTKSSNDNSVTTNNVAIKVDKNTASVTETNNLALAKKMNAAVQEVIVREQRSGGLLAGTGPGYR